MRSDDREPVGGPSCLAGALRTPKEAGGRPTLGQRGYAARPGARLGARVPAARPRRLKLVEGEPAIRIEVVCGDEEPHGRLIHQGRLGQRASRARVRDRALEFLRLELRVGVRVMRDEGFVPRDRMHRPRGRRVQAHSAHLDERSSEARSGTRVEGGYVPRRQILIGERALRPLLIVGRELDTIRPRVRTWQARITVDPRWHAADTVGQLHGWHLMRRRQGVAWRGTAPARPGLKAAAKLALEHACPFLCRRAHEDAPPTVRGDREEIVVAIAVQVDNEGRLIERKAHLRKRVGREQVGRSPGHAKAWIPSDAVGDAALGEMTVMSAVVSEMTAAVRPVHHDACEDAGWPTAAVGIAEGEGHRGIGRERHERRDLRERMSAVLSAVLSAVEHGHERPPCREYGGAHVAKVERGGLGGFACAAAHEEIEIAVEVCIDQIWARMAIGKAAPC